jgi:hypothetical protein
MKSQAAEWRERFVNHIADKGIVSRIYRDLSELCNKKKSSLKKMGKKT